MPASAIISLPARRSSIRFREDDKMRRWQDDKGIPLSSCHLLILSSSLNLMLDLRAGKLMMAEAGIVAIQRQQ